MSLRAVIFAFFASLATFPRPPQDEKRTLVVLIDDSLSMEEIDPPVAGEERRKLASVADTKETELRTLTRAELVRRVFGNPRIDLRRLERRYHIAAYSFSERLGDRTSLGDLLGRYRPSGYGTAMGEALSQALRREPDAAAVLVVSDFKNNVGMSLEDLGGEFQFRCLPVYTILAGIARPSGDVSLEQTEGGPVAIAGEDYACSFWVRHRGLAGEVVQLGAWLVPQGQDRSMIEATERAAGFSVRLSGPRERVQMVLRARTPGQYRIVIRADPRGGERSIENNYLSLPLRVVSNRIKVLYVEGPPRYEYRFLKNALLRDEKILCHTLLTSADVDYEQECSRGLVPAREFPKTRELLFQYDVLILGDVDPARLGGEEVWKNIEAFVTESGGGLILISGQKNPRLLLDKPALQSLIPVEPEQPRTDVDVDCDRPLRYILSHPHAITRYRHLEAQPGKSLEHWEDRDDRGDGQVGVHWFQRIKKVTPTASTLVEVVGADEDRRRFPLFVVHPYGLGRIFWSGTDETWRWRRGVGDLPWFYPFWQNVLSWVRQGRLLGALRYRVEIDPPRCRLGGKVRIGATDFGDRFQKRSVLNLSVEIESPRGRRETIQLQKDPLRAGYYEREYLPTEIGHYVLWVQEDPVRIQHRFSVFLDTRESEDRPPDLSLWRRLADQSYQVRKGVPQHYSLDRIEDLLGALPNAKEGERIAEERKRKSALPHPAVRASKMWCTYPGYLKKPSTLPDRPHGHVIESVPLHTHVRFEVEASLPLREAWLISAARGREPLSIRKEFTVAGEFTVSEADCRVWLELIAKNGLVNRNPIRWTIVGEEDHPPTIRVLDPSVETEEIAEGGFRPFLFEVRDDHGVGEVTIERLVEDGNASEWKRVPGTVVSGRKGEGRILVAAFLDLGEYRAGDRLWVRASAADLKDVGPANRVFVPPVQVALRSRREIEDAIDRESERILTALTEIRSRLCNEIRWLEGLAEQRKLEADLRRGMLERSLEICWIVDRLFSTSRELDRLLKRGRYSQVLSNPQACKVEGVVRDVIHLVGSESPDGPLSKGLLCLKEGAGQREQLRIATEHLKDSDRRLRRIQGQYFGWRTSQLLIWELRRTLEQQKRVRVLLETMRKP